VDYRNSDDEARTQDSDANRFDIGLGSAGGARWSWRLDYLNLDVNYDDAPDYAYERGGAEIGVPVGARSQFLVSGGRESDPLADRTKGGLDESWWNVGWRWIPTSRQDFEVRVGDRFYGTAWDAKWTRRGSRANLAVDYTEGPQTANSLEFDSNTTLPGGGYGQATPDARVFIRKRLSGLVTWGTAKSDWDLRIYGEQRDYADPQVAPADTEFESDDEAYGVRADWTWRGFTRSRLVADGWWEEQDFEEGQGNFGRFSLGLVRELSQTLDLSLTYYRLIKNSEAIDDYRDNSVQLELAWYP
jgi:hypothetical protein